MIKPEDVPESLVENYADRFSLAYWDGARGEHVAEFLNAAIEAGIVVRRIPDADDPRVLRRAILLMERSWLQGLGLRNTQHYIEKARKELESESKVLRRALENLAMILASPERGVEKTVELWIDQARKELEAEDAADVADAETALAENESVPFEDMQLPFEGPTVVIEPVLDPARVLATAAIIYGMRGLPLSEGMCRKDSMKAKPYKLKEADK